MLALVVLGLVACESASSFRLNKVTENQDKAIYHRSNYDDYLVNLNEQKQNLTIQKEYFDSQIENITMQKDNLDTKIDKLDAQKDDIDREIDKLIRQKDDIDKETDNVYRTKDDFDRNIDYLNRKKDQLDSRIDKVDSEIENYNIDSNRDVHKVYLAEVKDNEYRITINLSGYNKNEIVVKSGKRRVVIQAFHDVLGESKRSFQNIRSLPDYVSENGSWSYELNVLRIFFPITESTRQNN